MKQADCEVQHVTKEAELDKLSRESDAKIKVLEQTLSVSNAKVSTKQADLEKSNAKIKILEGNPSRKADPDIAAKITIARQASDAKEHLATIRALKRVISS
ncbi:hypothetical protein B0H19DRAFT_153269 [Mycena capillaripes]|nr:hypothetical protein B0H19DRAFT_153269 [Mycena capillaripes]